MKAVKFPQCNSAFGANQSQYNTLPAHIGEPSKGIVTTCYKLSFIERIKILFTGCIFFQQLTFSFDLQPQRPSIVNPVTDPPNDDDKWMNHKFLFQCPICSKETKSKQAISPSITTIVIDDMHNPDFKSSIENVSEHYDAIKNKFKNLDNP